MKIDKFHTQITSAKLSVDIGGSKGKIGTLEVQPSHGACFLPESLPVGGTTVTCTLALGAFAGVSCTRMFWKGIKGSQKKSAQVSVLKDGNQLPRQRSLIERITKQGLLSIITVPVFIASSAIGGITGSVLGHFGYPHFNYRYQEVIQKRFCPVQPSSLGMKEGLTAQRSPFLKV